ncbi:hypothetical protein IW261DRAFT_1565636 [Armillaria novae-zelandiae]|uniref:NADH:flavin oxidoreductase/NADH oxidase N-terminal domain-containing protein n=1 Tax=Armillaria novae-zelandiae TaxID=153914 RepID=A0AA39P5A2_9AGAR|nr:hypothetical protein IW261DRAFT_1565636 [Armillaria novae-zelandiae]
MNPIALAPLLLVVRDYYVQCTEVPGILLITEGTIVAPKASGIPSLPEIWTEEQITAWAEIINGGIHAQGSYIYMQIAAFGCQALPNYLKSCDPMFLHVGV